MSSQAETLLSPSELLDQSAGRMPHRLRDLEHIDPEQRITLPTLTSELGALLGPVDSGGSKQSDRVIGVEAEDTQRIERLRVERGLYIYDDDPRYKTADQLVKTSFKSGVRLAWQERLLLPFPLMLDRRYTFQPGVVFPAREYGKVALSAEFLTRAKKAQSSNKHAQNESLKPDERRELIKKAGRGVLRSFLDGIDGVAADYEEQRELLSSVHRQTQGLRPGSRSKNPRNSYRAKNLEKKLKKVDDIAHDTIDIAAINNNWGSKELLGAHKAMTKKHWRGRSPRENAIGLQDTINMVGLFINARRFKLLQSREACEAYLIVNAEDTDPRVQEAIA